MESKGIIETGVDKLVAIVKERGKIALSDAAKELGVSTSVIQEWVDFLEEEGIVSIEYNLTKPYLVDRKLTKKEVQEKAKEFLNQRDIFVRKAEVSLSILNKESGDLKNVKAEFDKLKSELGMSLDTVKSELKDLEKYQQSEVEKQRCQNGVPEKIFSAEKFALERHSAALALARTSKASFLTPVPRTMSRIPTTSP